jgi:hypothetical protein
MVEIWKDIPGFLEYQVSNLGRVKSFKGKKEKILRPFYTGSGYLQVGLTQCGRQNLKYVHRLVLWAFEGHPKGRQCDHINMIKDDNRIENLRWVTRKQNMKNTIRQMTFEEYGEYMKLRQMEESKNKSYKIFDI